MLLRWAMWPLCLWMYFVVFSSLFMLLFLCCFFCLSHLCSVFLFYVVCCFVPVGILVDLVSYTCRLFQHGSDIFNCFVLSSLSGFFYIWCLCLSLVLIFLIGVVFSSLYYSELSCISFILFLNCVVHPNFFRPGPTDLQLVFSSLLSFCYIKL